jgi:hypothetical protein
MRNRILAVLISLLLVAAGSFLVASPARAVAAAPGCPDPGFCLHDNPYVGPLFFAGAAPPRYQCLQPVPVGASFVTNNTAYQWWAFHTHNCTGSHYPLHAWVNENLAYTPAWDNNIAAVFRTPLQN